MTAHPSLTNMQAELVRRGLPADYVDRIVDELRDHQEDSAAEIARACGDSTQASELAESRLGNPRVLAGRIVSEYRARFFAGRHPMVTFLVAPLPALLLAWILYLLAAYLVFAGVESTLLSNEGSAGQHIGVLRAVDFLLVFAVPLLVAAGFCRLARRTCAGLHWAAISTGLICFAALSLQTQITPPTMGPGTGRYLVGLGLHTSLLSLSDWAHVLQAVVPCMALVLTFLFHRIETLRHSRGMETA